MKKSMYGHILNKPLKINTCRLHQFACITLSTPIHINSFVAQR